LRALHNTAVREMIAREEVTGEQRKLNNGELQDLYCSF
jgi:hypothetical protein